MLTLASVFSFIIVAISATSNLTKCVETLTALNIYNISCMDGDCVSISAAGSVSFHKPTSSVLVSGDYKQDDGTPYAFFNVYNNNASILKYSKQWKSIAKKNKYFIPDSIRTYTRITAHPTEDMFFIYGIQLLQAYNATTYLLIWEANISHCFPSNPQTLIYNDAMFLHNGMLK